MENERNSRQEQAAETREKLLAAAKSLFAEKGYHATPVRAINRALNMGDGILYHYFPGGKKEILMVLLKESFENRVRKLNQTNEQVEKLPLEEVLNVVFTRSQELMTTDNELMRILIRESNILELREMEQLSAMIQDRIEWLANFLENRHKSGEIRKMDFKMCATQMMSMSMLMGIDKFVGINLVGEVDPTAYRKQVISFMMDSWRK